MGRGDRREGRGSRKGRRRGKREREEKWNLGERGKGGEMKGGGRGGESFYISAEMLQEKTQSLAGLALGESPVDHPSLAGKNGLDRSLFRGRFPPTV